MRIEYSSSAIIFSDTTSVSELLSSSLSRQGLSVSSFSLDDQNSPQTLSPSGYVFIISLNQSPVSESLLELLKNFDQTYSPKTVFVNSAFNSSDISLDMFHDHRTISIPDIFGPSTTSVIKSPLNKLLLGLALNEKNISLPAHEKVYPLPESDAVILIQKSIFSPQTKSKKFFINTENFTVEQITQKLNYHPNFSTEVSPRQISEQGMDPLPFSVDEEQLLHHFSTTISSLTRSRFLVDIDASTEVSSDTSVTQGYLPPTPSQEQSSTAQPIPQAQPPTPQSVDTAIPPASFFNLNTPQPLSSKSNTRLWLTVPFITALILVLLFFVGLLLFNLTIKDLSQSNYQSLLAKARFSNLFISLTTSPAKLLTRLNISFTQPVTYKLSALSDLTSATVDLIEDRHIFLNSSQIHLQSILQNETPKEGYSLAPSLNALENKYLLAQSLALTDKPGLLTSLNSDRQSLYPFYSLTALPASTQSLTFLILIQNPYELRPTGGFINSIGLASLKDGSIYDLQTFDVYSLDDQLRGHVQPPTPLVQVLGEANWYLRDSNWSPHFPDSAEQAAWFVEKAIGRKVDGVVAINLPLLSTLLEITGPLSVPGLNQPVTSANLSDLVLSQSGLSLVADSHSNILGKTTEAIFHHFKDSELKSDKDLLNKLTQALNSKQLLLWSPSLSVPVHWSGALSQVQCHVSCFADYLATIDSNLGVNQVNYHLSKSSSLNINQNSSQVSHQLESVYSNSSPTLNFTNYLRIYLPLSSQIQSLEVGNELVTAYDIAFDHDLKVIGTLVEVPASARTMVRLNYINPVLNATTYFLRLQSQPSTADAFTLNISSNNLVFAAVKTPSSTTQLTPTSPLSYNMPLSQDYTFELRYK